MPGAAAAEAEARGAGGAAVSKLRAQVAGALATLLHAVASHVTATAALVTPHCRCLEVIIKISAESLRMLLISGTGELYQGSLVEDFRPLPQRAHGIE